MEYFSGVIVGIVVGFVFGYITGIDEKNKSKDQNND